MLSIDGGFVNNDTQITIYLRNTGSSALTVDKAYVDGVLQSMKSVVLIPDQVPTVVITGNGTNWIVGSVHQVRIVGDGKEVIWNTRGHSGGGHYDEVQIYSLLILRK